jgi:hypothetical protein
MAGRPDYTAPQAASFGWIQAAQSAANTALSETIDEGGATVYTYLYGLEIQVRGAATGVEVCVQLEEAVIPIVHYVTYIPSGAAVGFVRNIPFPVPLRCTAGRDVLMKASAAGAGSIIRLIAFCSYQTR